MTIPTSVSSIRELQLYIDKLEAYESGNSDDVPYVPAQVLIRAKEEIELLNVRIAVDERHMINFIRAREASRE